MFLKNKREICFNISKEVLSTIFKINCLRINKDAVQLSITDILY
jgi:hypothetical protein